MTGGQRVVPLYKEPKNSPFIPNIQKQIYGERLVESGHYPAQPGQQPAQDSTGYQQRPGLNPLVNLQVYQPTKPKEGPKMQPNLFYPTAVPTPYYPPQFSYQLPSYMTGSCQQQTQVPIFRTYNINIDGITGDPGKVNLIYEDMLPTKQFVGITTTIGERMNIYNFVRAMMFPQGDGKNIGLDGKSEDTILSHLKFMDLNPYNTYKFSNNPYKGLPIGFLIYRSCYPIRHDAAESTIVCAKNSVGTNIRVYKLTEGSYRVEKKIADFDEWREVSYYEYVREHIIRKKECPNFTILYGYYISENSKIDFDKIATLRGIQVRSEPKFIPSQNPPLFKHAKQPVIHPSIALDGPCQGCPQATSQFIAQVGGIRLLNRNNSNDDIDADSDYDVGQDSDGDKNNDGIILGPSDPIGDGPKQKGGSAAAAEQQLPMATNTTTTNVVLNPDAYLGKALVLMTEAPNYNLFGWASKTYQMDGNIRRQINTGFHLDKVWYSVLFQIMTALYAAQIHKIYFHDFTVEDNIYIKDVSTFGAVTKYWKYIIDGFHYYIPNYGYIAMIDSNFKDLPSQLTMNTICPAVKTEYKIYSKFLDPNISELQFKEQTFEAFKRSFDSNVFDQSFVNFGGCKPPPEVIFLLNQIKTQASNDTDKDIGKYLHTYMRRFMNNRTGTYLKETEVGNIRRDEQKDFKKGQLVVYEDGTSSYKFVIFVGLSNTGVANILTKNEPSNEDVIEMTVPVTSLYGYTKMEPVIQSFKPNESSLTEDDLLETYVMNAK
jgi:hypothetical protein